MKTSELAKSLGARNLQAVAQFYKCTSKHLRDVRARNEPGFRAMVIGYVEFNKQ